MDDPFPDEGWQTWIESGLEEDQGTQQLGLIGRPGEGGKDKKTCSKDHSSSTPRLSDRVLDWKLGVLYFI